MDESTSGSLVSICGSRTVNVELILNELNCNVSLVTKDRVTQSNSVAH